jgi:hypothetical protein
MAVAGLKVEWKAGWKAANRTVSELQRIKQGREGLC